MYALTTILTAFHLLSLMFWIGGLVSITRVVSAGAEQSDEVKKHLAALARKLYRVVASPWMGFALVSGLGLIGAAHGLQFRHGWFHGKLAAVVVMLGMHFYLGSVVRAAETSGITPGTLKTVRGIQLAVLVAAAFAVACIVIWKGLSPGV